MRLGMVGARTIARLSLSGIIQSGIDVRAICATPSGAAHTREVARQYGIPDALDDYHDLVARDDIDVVYVGVPNHLHYEVARAALEAGKSVVLEKPMTSTIEEAEALASYAEDKGLFLWEAIVPLHQPSFALLRDAIPELGDLHIATIAYSQYSSRYDAFREGTVLPAFDAKKSGGALMDLGVYCMGMAIGLFGAPRHATYVPNVERAIDTSGVAVLDYGPYKAIVICAKDCGAPSGLLIQGTEGYITSSKGPNDCGSFTIHRNDGSEEVRGADEPSRFVHEFADFKRQWEEGDLATCREELARSLTVSRVMTGMRRDAGILFPADEGLGRDAS